MGNRNRRREKGLRLAICGSLTVRRLPAVLLLLFLSLSHALSIEAFRDTSAVATALILIQRHRLSAFLTSSPMIRGESIPAILIQ